MRICQYPLVWLVRRLACLGSACALNKINFNGGVIIIGSLLWDNAKRSEWRQRSLRPLKTKIPVRLRIRYGRESGGKRKQTYTMIFSNHATTEFGQGYIVGFNKIIKKPAVLEKQAFALAEAEEICTYQRPLLSKSWGAVGLLINPRIDSKDKVGYDVIKVSWKKLFHEYSESYDHWQYCIGSEQPVIDKDGFLNIEWTPEMNGFDFLIATALIPKPKSVLTAKQIAARMIEREYTDYFDKNRANNIATFQDNEILKYLRDLKQARP